MQHLSKLIVGTLSLAVMLLGFVPSLARAQMAIVERIDVPNNCVELFNASVTTAFSAEKTAPQERAEGTVTASIDGGDVNLKIAAVILKYQWLATFEKGQDDCLWMCSEFFPFPNPSPITLKGVSSRLP